MGELVFAHLRSLIAVRITPMDAVGALVGPVDVVTVRVDGDMGR